MHREKRSSRRTTSFASVRIKTDHTQYNDPLSNLCSHTGTNYREKLQSVNGYVLEVLSAPLDSFQISNVLALNSCWFIYIAKNTLGMIRESSLNTRLLLQYRPFSSIRSKVTSHERNIAWRSRHPKSLCRTISPPGLTVCMTELQSHIAIYGCPNRLHKACPWRFKMNEIGSLLYFYHKTAHEIVPFPNWSNYLSELGFQGRILLIRQGSISAQLTKKLTIDHSIEHPQLCLVCHLPQ